MSLPLVTMADWRAQVEKELAGASFDKALVHSTAEGIPLQPLYTESAATTGVPDAPARFLICMRQRDGQVQRLADDAEGGAEAVWLTERSGKLIDAAVDLATAPDPARRPALLVDVGDPGETLAALRGRAGERGVLAAELHFALGADPLGRIAIGRAAPDSLDGELAKLAGLAEVVDDTSPYATACVVSTLPYHDAGADAADELAIALSTGAAYLRALVEGGLDVAVAARQILVRVAVGRDTFGETCKLRALRRTWRKLVAAAGAPDAPLRIHAVCSSRTLTERDIGVNMLRVTTQVFAAVLGGADLVTPAAYDEALTPPSPLGERIARNTALVLREESHLGRVIDPAAGSYYFEARTDALGREAWRRFRALESEGGVARALLDGTLATRLEASWQKRREAIVKRRETITGTSEFANLEDRVVTNGTVAIRPPGLLPVHHDSEPFDQLRTHADALDQSRRSPEVLLLTLGPPSEHRGRVGFATGLFATAGLRTREASAPRTAAIACVCGSDDRYAAEAVDAVRALKAAGVVHVLLAGRPGALEASLREAGVETFIFVGCDLVAAVTPLLGERPW